MKLKIQITIGAFLLMLCIVSSAQATNLLVVNNNDSGIGSLREATVKAKNGDSISFKDSYIIFLKSSISLGDKSLTINGLVGDKKVHLNGSYRDDNNDTIDDDGIYTNVITANISNDVKILLQNLIVENGAIQNYNIGTFNSNGAGINISSNRGSILIENCTIRNNYLTSILEDAKTLNSDQLYLSGAGIYSSSGVTLHNCEIVNNKIIVAIKNNSTNKDIKVMINGAGICADANMNACIIAGNILSVTFDAITELPFVHGAGAFNCMDITNCNFIGNRIISKNKISAYGAGLVGLGFGTVTNCNFMFNNCENDYSKKGNAFFTINDVIKNCIVYKNNANTLDESISHGFLDQFITYIAITDSSLLPEKEADRIGWTVLKESPFVTDPTPGKDGIWGTDDDSYGDLNLKSNSPCINAGDPNTTIKFDTDFYGQARIVDNHIDIGASEYFFKIITFSLRGKVHAESAALIRGMVYAYIANNPLEIIDSCKINNDGTFEFTALSPEKYILKAVPHNTSSYLPTYYGNEINVEKAYPIDVDDSFYDVDIHLKSQSTDIDENSAASQPKMFPTITSDIVTFYNVENIEEITIYNITGCIVATYTAIQNQISVSQLSQGVYVVALKANNAITKHKLVKE